MSQKVYLIILKIGIFLSLMSLLFISRIMLFPFITSKQIPFNVIVEISFLFWIVFIIKYPQWNPFKGMKSKKTLLSYFQPWKILKKSEENNNHNLISLGFILFIVALTLSSIIGVDFNLSFWGDAERMLAVFHVLHFLIFYFIIITVIRDKKDWLWLLTTLFVLIFLVSIKSFTWMKDSIDSFHLIYFLAYGFLAFNVMQKKLDWKWLLMILPIFFFISSGKNVEFSTQTFLGNTTYVSGLMIFGIYFSFFLFLKIKHKFYRYLYLLPLPFILLTFKNCTTSGAFVGLGFSIIVFCFLYTILSKNRKLKLFSLALFIILTASVVFIFNNRDIPWIANNGIIRNISTNKTTFQTRLVSWRAAQKDFKNHPLLGVGHGNYATVFDKNFDPVFFNYLKSETYFDRAHNNVIEIASTSGLLGLLTYLSIFIAMTFYLIKVLFDKRISLIDFCLLFSLFTAYFVQNLAVFDSFATYLSLVILLGYVHYLVNHKKDEGNEETLLAEGDKKLNDPEIYTFFGVGILILIVIFQFNINPVKGFEKIFVSQEHFSKGELVLAMEAAKESLSGNTVLDRDSRNITINSIISNERNFQYLTPEKGQEVIDYALELVETNLSYNENDTLTLLQLARLLDMASRVSRYEENRKVYMTKKIEVIDKAISISPGRIPLYHLKAQFLINSKNFDGAIIELKKSKKLNESMFENNCLLAQTYLMAGDNGDHYDQSGYKELDICLEKKGVKMLSLKKVIDKGIKHYEDAQDFDKLIELREYFALKENKNLEAWIELMELNKKMGRKEQAALAAKRVVEIDSSKKAEIDKFIDSLK